MVRILSPGGVASVNIQSEACLGSTDEINTLEHVQVRGALETPSEICFILSMDRREKYVGLEANLSLRRKLIIFYETINNTIG